MTTISADEAPDLQTMRDRALHLADLGYRVFRLQENGTRPINVGWPELATADPNKVNDWWSDINGQSENYNIGIATGDGLIALDFDCKNGKPGFAARDEWLQSGMPSTGIATTQSGGEHWFFSFDPKIDLGNSVSTVADGVDTRAGRGYVVAPGSTIDGKHYRWQSTPTATQDLTALPDWLFHKILNKTPLRQPQETVPVIELDRKPAIDRATQYLYGPAPSAQEGDAGDQTTFKVAAQLKDYGLSEETAFNLMSEHWNQHKASPPWDEDDLQRKVANAFAYGNNAPGSADPTAEFEPTFIPNTDSDPNYKPDLFPLPNTVSRFDAKNIPTRKFIFNGMFARSTVSALVAPSGVGKTTLTMQMCLSAVSGKPYSSFNPTAKHKVWMWNQEDDENELNRRLAAAMQSDNITFPDIGDRLHLNSGVSRRLTLAYRNDAGQIKRTRFADKVIEHIRENDIDLFVADPIVEFHQANENDNVEMASVGDTLRRIATQTNCAVLLVAHDRKPDQAGSDGHVGNQHAMRGASSVQGITRAILTLYGASEKDLKELRVPPTEMNRFVRLDGAKNNLALVSGEASWFRRTGETLPNGDEVGVLAPVGGPVSVREEFGIEEDAEMEVRTDQIAETVRQMQELAEGEDGSIMWSDVLKALVASDIGSKATLYRWQRMALDGRKEGSLLAGSGKLVFKQHGERKLTIRFVKAD